MENDGTLQLGVYDDCNLLDEHEDTSESQVNASKEVDTKINTK